VDTHLKKWLGWLSAIHDDIEQLLVNQNIFWEVQEVIKNNKRIHKPSSFYKYLGNTYTAYVTIGIRRQLKIDKKSISFARLLGEIGQHPSSLSRSYFKTLYEGSGVEHLADRHFDRFSEAGKHISVSMVEQDLAQLRSVGTQVEDFADKRIAHRDKRNPKTLPTFNEVDTCLDALDKLYVKYHLIFHGSAPHTLMPTYQYDWKEIFNEAWLPLDE
jgi:hypothetical protein